MILVVDAGGGTTVRMPCGLFPMEVTTKQMATTGRERTKIDFCEGRANTASTAWLGRRSALAICNMILCVIDWWSCVGRSIGSALIDMDVHQILSDRLEAVQDQLQGDPDIIADQMMQGRFERIKCSFGAAGCAVPTIPLPVPGLTPGFCHSGASIEDSTIVLTRCANI